MTRGVAPLRPPPSRRRVVGAIAAALVAAVTATALTAVVSSPDASAAISPTGWNTVVSKNSSKCVDARSGASANGTAVQQQACNSSTAQQWQFQPTTNGYVRVNALNNAAQSLDVTNVSTADSAPIQLWSYSNGLNQQWLPVEEADGAYHLVNRNSGKCLDVPGASTNDGLQLQQYTCNGTAAQSFRVNPVDGTPPTDPPTGQPDLGPNVSIFDPSMASSTIQNKLNSVFSQQERNQFGEQRVALLFKPGTYNVSANVGFYTQVAGLGLTPDSVNINGAVHVEADWFPPQNATQNFWRGAEGLTITPPGGLDRWAVSQASSYRRNHLKGNLALDDGGWSSGGYMADTVVDGQVRSGSQQQWISRNTNWGSWTGQNWNMVFVGAQNAPAGTFPNPPYTKVAQTPVVREKPYLYVDAAGNYQVFVPALRNNSAGPGWVGGNPAGQSLPIDQFYIVKPGATAATINAQLAAGKNLLFTPGVYRLSDTLRINRADTVVLGLGLATLMPTSGTQPHHRRRRRRCEDRRPADRRGTDQFAAADGDRPERIVGEPCGEPDLAARRLLPDRRRRRRQGDRDAADQQQQRDHRPHLVVARRPQHRRRLEHQHRRHRPRRQRQRRHGVRAVRRALPEVPDDLERQRRADVLLPERDAVRPAEPGRLDERLHPRLRGVQGAPIRSPRTRRGGWAATASSTTIRASSPTARSRYRTRRA